MSDLVGNPNCWLSHDVAHLVLRCSYFPQVHAFYTQCPGADAATCNCGVMIQCGDDVFVINRCYGENDPKSKPYLLKNKDLCKGAKIYENKGGKEITVCMCFCLILRR